MRGTTSTSWARCTASPSDSVIRMKRLRKISANVGALRGAHFLLSAALLLAAVPAAAQHLGQGDFDFHLDTAAFRGRDGKVVSQVFLRIGNHSLRFKESGKAEWKTRVV